MSGLNSEQRKAVDRVEGPVLILAGAGTGKTRVITARIAEMLRRGIEPENILAVTFTNKAASEMRERVGKQVKREAAKQVMICTFHSLCVRILRQSIDRLGYKKNFTIYAQSDQVGLMRKLITRKGGKDEKLDANLVLSLISRTKNSGVPISSDGGDDFIVSLARAYQDELKTLNAVDFDDLLVLAKKVLREHEDVRAQWRERFRYLMVDEFQDTNRLQMDVLKALAGDEKNVCVVGDDDQSIYGWRGAEVANILDFEQSFPGALVVKLEQNYRSTTPILGAANGVIRHNRDRREKKLWSEKAGSDLVRVVAMPTEQEEAEHIVMEMVDQREREGRKWEDFAVLFRMNSQSRLFEEQFRRNEVPYRLVGGQSFFDRREVRDLLAYLKVFLNPDDDVNLLRIINSPPRGISANTVGLATAHSAEAECSVYAALWHTDFTGQLSRRAQGAIQEFVRMVESRREWAASGRGGYAGMMEDLLKEMDYPAYLRRQCKTDEEAATRNENVREMVEAMRDHEARSGGGLGEFLDEVALAKDKEDEKEDDLESKKGVCLITMHAAKGLEFPRVWLVGAEEGVLPHSRSLEEGSRDEERRLFYVGITRAMERLTITYCATRKRWGDAMPCYPSSFLNELDEQYVERLGYDEVAQVEASEEEAAAYFARMKEMLGKSG
ncbi:MAG: UvrD-helicase domain-containing protein [Verrucomicrobiota bacterium]